MTDPRKAAEAALATALHVEYCDEDACTTYHRSDLHRDFYIGRAAAILDASPALTSMLTPDPEQARHAAIGAAVERLLDGGCGLTMVTLAREDDLYICETPGSSGRADTLIAAIVAALGDET